MTTELLIKLTSRELQAVKEWVAATRDGNGNPPRVVEVATRLGISASSMNGMLRRLERKGYAQHRCRGQWRMLGYPLTQSARAAPWPERVTKGEAAVIESYHRIESEGGVPTLAAIGRMLGLSRNTIHGHMSNLARKRLAVRVDRGDVKAYGVAWQITKGG